MLQSWRDHNAWHARDLLGHFGTYYRRYSTPSINRPWPADELLAAVGLAEHGHKQIRMLSGGQRRRLDVAIADGTVANLAQQVVGLDEVRWTHHGQRHTHHTSESTQFVIDLVRQHGESITNLEVRRSTLEDTYLSLVHQAESDDHHEAHADMLEATR